MKKILSEVAPAKQDATQEPDNYAHAYKLEPGDVLHVNGFPVEYVGGEVVGTNTALPEERDREELK